LPTIKAFQRHELTLIRMEDILNHGSDGVSGHVGGVQAAAPTMATGRVSSSAELCHRMVDFCQRLTTAKRKVLEDPDLYPEHTRHALPDSDATRIDQKMRRRKVCEKLVLVPGKLDHASIVAYSVEDRRQSLKSFCGTVSSVNAGTKNANNSCTTSPLLPSLALRAPCASTEDLTFRDDEEDEEGTPTPSVSLCSSPSTNGGSLAVTPVHQPKREQRGGEGVSDNSGNLKVATAAAASLGCEDRKNKKKKK
jgi:hypothetical protein